MLAMLLSLISVVAIIGMAVLHIEMRRAAPGWSPGQPLPWHKLRQRWG